MKYDSEIQQDVIEELKWEPVLNAAEIGVAVKNGIVTLSGQVNSYAKKIVAERAAKRVSGVKAVAEDIEVKLGITDKKSDTEIAEAVLNEFKWNSTVQEDKIKVKVEDGFVTLEGEVEWEYQRAAARKIVEKLAGVKGIINNISVSPKMNIEGIKQKISSAFHRSATIDAEKIEVETADGKVILSGKVRSWAEKKDAENAAWAAPGISQVINNLEIDIETLVF